MTQKSLVTQKASIQWWKPHGNNPNNMHTFEADYYSDEFDEKLSELQNDPEVRIIQINKPLRVGE